MERSTEEGSSPKRLLAVAFGLALAPFVLGLGFVAVARWREGDGIGALMLVAVLGVVPVSLLLRKAARARVWARFDDGPVLGRRDREALAEHLPLVAVFALCGLTPGMSVLQAVTAYAQWLAVLTLAAVALTVAGRRAQAAWHRENP